MYGQMICKFLFIKNKLKDKKKNMIVTVYGSIRYNKIKWSWFLKKCYIFNEHLAHLSTLLHNKIRQSGYLAIDLWRLQSSWKTFKVLENKLRIKILEGNKQIRNRIFKFLFLLIYLQMFALNKIISKEFRLYIYIYTHL